MSLEITEMFDGIKNGSIELQQFHNWLCEPYNKLTDEKINEVAEYHGIDSLYETGILEFARAILRKAQEK